VQSIVELSLSFLDVGFAEVYQMIQNLNNRKIPKVVSEITLLTASSSLPVTIEG
jgi:hypothetical protein